VERTLLTHNETAPAGARMGAVSFIHRFGAAWIHNYIAKVDSQLHSNTLS